MVPSDLYLNPYIRKSDGWQRTSNYKIRLVTVIDVSLINANSIGAS
jgi:hypothetical protein